jgi:hypothetical protein
MTTPGRADCPDTFPWSGLALVARFLVPAAIIGFVLGWCVIRPLVRLVAPGGA